MSRKDKKTSSKILTSTLTALNKLSREELETIRWNINALLDEDFLNTQAEARSKKKEIK